MKPRRKENLPSQSPNQSVPTILVLKNMGRFVTLKKMRSKIILSDPVFNSFYFLASRQAKSKLQNNQTDNLTQM